MIAISIIIPTYERREDWKRWQILSLLGCHCWLSLFPSLYLIIKREKIESDDKSYHFVYVSAYDCYFHHNTYLWEDRRLIAITDPITYWTSLPMIAISIIIIYLWEVGRLIAMTDISLLGCHCWWLLFVSLYLLMRSGKIDSIDRSYHFLKVTANDCYFHHYTYLWEERRLIAMTDPINSWMPQLMIAISIIIPTYEKREDW